MSNIFRFNFQRKRGVVWVCDVAHSSAFLNSNASVIPLEEFLPRLYLVANFITKAAGGEFLKWTGDGFLSWFETPLYRDAEKMGKAASWAAYDLTFLTNVTSLGVKTETKFNLRHGIVYEHDALVLDIAHLDGHSSKDLIGRGVVLANRLASVNSVFPNIITHGDLLGAVIDCSASKKWRPSAQEREKYFKGEKWGTDNLYKAVERKYKSVSLNTVIKKARFAIKCSEGEAPSEGARMKYTQAFTRSMYNGPKWCKEIISEECRFMREDLKGSLEKILKIGESSLDGGFTKN